MKSYTNQKDKIGKFLIAVCIILAGIIFFQYVMILADYEGYDGKAQAVIQNIEMRHVYAKAVSYEEYRIFYTYTVEPDRNTAHSLSGSLHHQIYGLAGRLVSDMIQLIPRTWC